ncbi:MAG: methionine--tRNA ligase [bacterium]|nr:methionine--tRNA ligase [bacterium]
MNRNVLVAAAWPYVNGSLHLGHVAALLPADILARYFRAHGDHVLYVSGSDCHGTPILVSAEREGVAPEIIAGRYHDEVVEMLIHKLGFSYSLYSKTMGAFHQRTAQDLFRRLYDGGHMVEREEEQLYCVTCTRFLPDRYVEGTCPYCAARGARGDQCDQCGQTLDAGDLVTPQCKICHTKPERRRSTHLYFRLSAFEARLTAWIKERSVAWRSNASAVTASWLTRGLHDRPITRDLTWGIPVPVDAYVAKRMYVWFEAVMGYFSCSKEWAASTDNPEGWRQWWENDDALHYYVHGKDNIPFHTIIWPAMLMALGYKLPDAIVSSEYLNFEGVKLSKSAGMALWLPEALAKFDPDALRFVLVLNGPETHDTSFSWKEFQARVHGDLIGTIGNLWNRTYTLVYQHRDIIGSARPAVVADDSAKLLGAAAAAFTDVGTAIERTEFRVALQRILALAKQCNQYLNARQPWKLIRDPATQSDAAEAITTAAIFGDALRRLMAPFTPHIADALGTYLGCDDVRWCMPTTVPSPTAPPTPLIRHIDDALIEAELAKLAPPAP